MQDPTILDDDEVSHYINQYEIKGGHQSFFIGEDMAYIGHIARMIKDDFIIKY